MKMMRRMIKVFSLTMSLFFALGLMACGGSNTVDSSSTDAAVSGEKKSIRIGSKGFTENLIVSELYALALQDAGYEVERVFDVASSMDHVAITSNEIDVYPEYTGTGLIVILNEKPITDPDEVFEKISKEYREKFDLVWLKPAEANDGQGIVIRSDIAEKHRIKTLSDLQANADKIRFASQGEFEMREDGLPALEAVYGPFDFASIKVFSNSLKYDVLSNNEADAAPAYTTEGQLSQDEFTLLEDDKSAWPPYNIAPVMRREYYDVHPDVVEVIDAVNAELDTETITKLNARVDVEQEEYEDVAADYYETIKTKIQ